MRELGGAGVARQAKQRAAHARIPIGRAEADKGRHQINRLHRVRLVGERTGLGRLLDDLEAIAQPLHRGARDEDRAFQRVGALAVELIGNRRQQLVLGGNRRRAGVEQCKAAGAVGRLDHAGRETGLTDGRGLLVAGNACDRDAAAEQFSDAVAEMVRRVLHFGEHRARHAQDLQQLVVPFAGVDVEQQRARGVGGVCGVRLAAGEAPQEIAIDGAEQQFAALRALTRAGHLIEHPGHFSAGEIRIDDQAASGRNRRLVAFVL